MVKLAVTISNHCIAVNVGGGIEVETHIIEIENQELEELLKPQKYQTISISTVREKEGVK